MKSTEDRIQGHVLNYIAGLQAALDRVHVKNIYKAISVLHSARLSGNTIFVMGNGGSATTAGHFVCDLSKSTRQPDLPPFRVIGLADNMAMVSAYANDEGYEYAFARQLANHMRLNDVVLAISASGNSPNVLRAIELASRLGARTVGLTGFDGGQLRSQVQIEINVPSCSIKHVEDVHLALLHMMCDALTGIWTPTRLTVEKKESVPQSIG
jgi:D-sedoheptulose 7-phosphate isomerase